MAKTLRGQWRLNVVWEYVKALDLSNASDAGNRVFPTIPALTAGDLTSGTGDYQVDLLWHDQRTLAATSEELDLAGSLADAFGDTLTFVEVVALVIANRATTAGHNLIVGGASSAAWAALFGGSTHTVNVHASGVLAAFAPLDPAYVVTATSADKLKIDAGGENTVTYDILIAGRSA